MNKTFEDKCRDFILMLANRGCSSDLKKYDWNKWYKCAFSTINQPIGVYFRPKNEGRFEKWKKANYDAMRGDVLALLKKLPLNGTSELGAELEKIANKYGIKFGMVQKVFSVLVKYVVTNYYGDKGDFDSAMVSMEFPWVKNLVDVKKLPIPIDNIVLKSLKSLGSTLKIRNTGEFNEKKWSRFEEREWSKVTGEVEIFSKNSGMFPLEYEMSILWVKK